MITRALLLAALLLAIGATSAMGADDLRGRTVVIDPGHNGGNWDHGDVIARQIWAGGLWKDCDTWGARTADDYREPEHNWDVALRLRTLLVARGARVILTRTSNDGVGPCIPRRAAIGNLAHADAAISIHADGVADQSLRGFHVIMPADMGQSPTMLARSQTLGVLVRNALRRYGPTPVSNYQGTDGLVVRGDLGGLNLSRVPKVFTEIGNMRQDDDAAIISSPAGRQQEAEALAIGIGRFLLRR